MKNRITKTSRAAFIVVGTIIIIGTAGIFTYKKLTHKNPEVIATEVALTLNLAQRNYEIADSIVLHADDNYLRISDPEQNVYVAFSLMEGAYQKIMSMPRCQPRLLSNINFEVVANRIGYHPSKAPHDRYTDMLMKRRRID